ncbi:hypothetical protein QBC38DRAFT_469182 [Podospora fimiseda]|uniref:Secreted protein n=1 Tax=Podospora fimiseda TaxID=252190 RepID=A0AAN7BW06_9PEZI|nr:hypothetical protein QBC38DRAFT_469182 [Podospora fimiseda]
MFRPFWPAVFMGIVSGTQSLVHASLFRGSAGRMPAAHSLSISPPFPTTDRFPCLPKFLAGKWLNGVVIKLI